MNMLASLTTSADIAGEKDVLGGGSGPLESGIYKVKVAMAYLQESAGGALGLFLTFKTDTNQTLRQTVYVTSGRDKGKTHTYKDKDGNPQYLPGFLLANSLAQLTTGKEIFQLEPETKVIPIYNYDAKAEVPTSVPVVTELLGQEIWAGVVKQTVDKNVKNDAGQYVPSGDTRDENEIDKFFCAKDGYDKLTSAEIRAKRAGQEPDMEKCFFVQWGAKNTGVTRNKAKGVAAAGKPGAPKAPGAAAGTAKPGASLF